MAVDIKKLIAAINPDVYCDDSRDDSGVKLVRKVKSIVKEEGYLKAAKEAKLKESDYLDIVEVQETADPFSLAGLKAPIEQHKIVYDASSQTLEPIYFWVLDYVNKEYGGSEKLIDNFISSPGSGHFTEMQGRATKMQDEAMRIFGTLNNVLRSVLNIIYDLKEFKLRLAQYDDFDSKDGGRKNAALLSLKQVWLDGVDFKRGTSSIKGLAQQFEYVTLIDAFMAANSLSDLKRLDLNDRVRRILEQRLSEFLHWVKESERELRKRFEIEKTYLKSQVNSIKLYSRWLKPYLKAANRLEQNAPESADLVSAFNTSVFELVLMAKGEYEIKDDVEKGVLPKFFKKKKIRKHTPITIVELVFRSIPERADQRGGYIFRGKLEVTFTSFALNEDEMDVLKEQIAEDDFGDAYNFIEGATDKSLGELKDDLDELLGDKEEKKKKSNDDDVNPFAALFSFLGRSDSYKVKEKEKKDFSKGVPKDSDNEKVVRSQVILNARASCRRLYDSYKKVHGMPSFPPSIS